MFYPHPFIIGSNYLYCKLIIHIQFLSSSSIFCLFFSPRSMANSTKGIIFIGIFFFKNSRSSYLWRPQKASASFSFVSGRTVINTVARFRSGEQLAPVTVMREVLLFSRPKNEAVSSLIKFATLSFLCILLFISVLLKTIL